MTYKECPFCGSKNLDRAKPHEKPKEVGCLDCGQSEYHIIMLEVLDEGPGEGATLDLNGPPGKDEQRIAAHATMVSLGWTIT